MAADIAAGLTWSVPAGVSAQRQYDEVMWINLVETNMSHWAETRVYHTIGEFGGEIRLNSIPSPFNRPDVVVFEGFYSFAEVLFSWELRRKGIPYVVIPRGSLTKQAFHNHSWKNCLKKKIASFLFFKPYTRHALAVQFLTKQELIDSGSSWTNNPIIIPNGFNTPMSCKTEFSAEGLELIYIGRPTIYQKGLDILIEACVKMKSELMENNVHISIHAPEKNDYAQLKAMLLSANIKEVLTLKPAVTGAEKERCLFASDLFIMTSRFEGHPMGLIEALAYGLPVIVTPGTNMADEVSETNTGWLSDGTVEDLCNTLRNVILNRASLKEKSAHAKELASRYRWEVLAQKFHQEIDFLLKQKKA